MPPVDGRMGIELILSIVVIILTIPRAIHATQQLVQSFLRWKETTNPNVSVTPEIKKADDEIKPKVNAQLEEIR